MAGGKTEVKESNEEQVNCMCVSVWRTGERQKDTDSRWNSAGPSQSRALRLEMAVNRRHARLSVKLETSGAQQTAVRTSVHSHRPGKRGRQQGELEAETHFTSQSITACDGTKPALCRPLWTAVAAKYAPVKQPECLQNSYCSFLLGDKFSSLDLSQG